MLFRSGQWIPKLCKQNLQVPFIHLNIPYYSVYSDEQNLQVQFIHRGLGYLIFILNAVLFFKTRHLSQHLLYGKLRLTLAGLIKIQVILGILSLIFATAKNSFVVFGVLHQCNAMLVLLTLVWMIFIVRKSTGAESSAVPMG